MKNILKYFISFIILSSLLIGTGFVVAQTPNFNIDFLNLKQNLPIFFDGYEKIEVEGAWEVINDSGLALSPIKVGIIDSGIDASDGIHPEFQNVNLGSTPPKLKTDLEVDSQEPGPRGHGTQVAGIIGANNISFPNPANYISPHMNGILSGVHNLDYALEIRGKPLVSLPFFSLASRVMDLREKEVGVINMSFGSQILSGQIEFLTRGYERLFLKNSDILFIVAAGHFEPEFLDIFNLQSVNAELVAPANLGDNFNNVITVGATDLLDNRADFSNFGDAVSLSAPGVSVYTPAPRGHGDSPFEDYENEFFGTSASAPFVTGVAGLLKAINPDLTPAQIKQILIETADPIQTGEIDKRIGTGCYSNPNDLVNTGCRLNALKAVQAVLPTPPVTVSPWPQFQHDKRHTGQSPFQGPQTNNIKWTFTPTGTNTFINTPVVGPNGTVYFGAGTQSTGKLIALNPDGTLKWESSLLPSATPTNPAIITDSMVFIVFGSEDFGTNLIALDSENGSILWTHPVGNRVDFVTAASDDLIYFTNESGFLFSLTVSELGATENWSIDLGGIRLVDSAPAVDSTGTIYVIERTISRVTAVNPNGTINWIRTLPANTSASALILDNYTVVVATPNILKGLNPLDGTDIFSIAYPGTNSSTPILLPDNRVALVTENNNALHRIDTDTQTVDSTFTADFLPTRPNPVSDNQGTIYLKTDPDTIAAIANNDIILFSRSFSRLVGNFALSDNNTLYIPVLDGGVLKMVAVGP